jgi:hypothetical protein
METTSYIIKKEIHNSGFISRQLLLVSFSPRRACRWPSRASTDWFPLSHLVTRKWRYLGWTRQSSPLEAERGENKRKKTGKRRYRMAASTEQEKRIAYVLTNVLRHCCVPFHLISSWIYSSHLLYFISDECIVLQKNKANSTVTVLQAPAANTRLNSRFMIIWKYK